jgi:hypothetical protein
MEPQPMTDDPNPAEIRAFLESGIEADPSQPPIDWSKTPLDICREIARLRTALAVAHGRIEAMYVRRHAEPGERPVEAGGMGDSGQPQDGAPGASGRAGNGQ